MAGGGKLALWWARSNRVLVRVSRGVPTQDASRRSARVILRRRAHRLFAPATTTALSAWADGSSWAKVILPLQQHGLRVIAAPIPSATFRDHALLPQPCKPRAISGEQVIARIDRRAGHERDHIVRTAKPGMDRPLVGRADLGECGALRGRAEADELQRVPRRPAVAGEVRDHVAVGLPGVEREGVAAGIALEKVGRRTAVERVGAGVAVNGVRQ